MKSIAIALLVAFGAAEASAQSLRISDRDRRDHGDRRGDRWQSCHVEVELVPRNGRRNLYETWSPVNVRGRCNARDLYAMDKFFPRIRNGKTYDVYILDAWRVRR